MGFKTVMNLVWVIYRLEKNDERNQGKSCICPPSRSNGDTRIFLTDNKPFRRDERIRRSCGV